MVLGCPIGRGLSAFTYRTSTVYGWPFQDHSANSSLCNSPTLTALRSDRIPRHPPHNGCCLTYGWVWAVSRSLAATEEIEVSFSSWGYLDDSVRPVCPLGLCIHPSVMRIYRTGFPHSEISGSKVVCTSPELIAACHVLHRLPMPRHPPYALSSLIQRAFKRDTALLLPYELSKNVSGFLMPEKFRLLIGGDNRARTGNLRRARAALSQLSYIPEPVRSFRKTWWA